MRIASKFFDEGNLAIAIATLFEGSGGELYLVERHDRRADEARPEAKQVLHAFLDPPKPYCKRVTRHTHRQSQTGESRMSAAPTT